MATMEEVLKALMEQQKVIAAQMEEQNQKIEEQQRLFGRMVDQFKEFEKAMEYARCQEETVQALKLQEKSSKFTTPVQKSMLPTPSKMGTTAFSHQSNVQKPPPRFIPASERAEKIAKGLCYYCDKPFERGHKCANRTTQLFLVEPHPKQILSQRIKKRGSRAAVQYLVEWEGVPATEATWEWAAEFEQRFPHFQL
ncbi:hypothetical protein Cgig2_028176 [Carnegiea gigantea]|uniref:Chromo domain-containing protein n=1 Tax=Carnegiea gigantea TaxID=171969 RepID=A0A9Q1GSF9_9CARY|nr:hypothetical protein Cgig2_028176 [Carnegiea gigantea]